MFVWALHPWPEVARYVRNTVTQKTLVSRPVIKSPFSTILASPSFPSLPGLLIPIDRDFEGSFMADNLAHPNNRRQVVAIDVLPDDVLLEILEFYAVRYQDINFTRVSFQYAKRNMRSWQSLVHVCRGWRDLVFGSPRRLKLQLCCTTKTPARETLDVWPAFPLLILGDVSKRSVNNVISELENSDRICQINLTSSNWQIETLLAAMQKPFPELALLYLSFVGVPVLPDSFLGGSAPRLRYLTLVSITFPGLPKLLLSATHLVELCLLENPHSGYISAEAMTTYLSMLTSLETLRLEFGSLRSSPDQESRFPPTRTVYPALTQISFEGVNEYLEELVARIDAPRLFRLSIKFFSKIESDTPELIQFISRTPTFEAPIETRVVFERLAALVTLQSETSHSDEVRVKISCRMLDWELSFLAQICTSSFSATENLDIYENLYSSPDWKDDIENTEWLDLLLPFTAVKNLYLSKKYASHIAPALQELTGGRTTEVLPALQNVLLEGIQASEPVHEGIGQFISARQLTNRPVAISVWERDSLQEAVTLMGRP